MIEKILKSHILLVPQNIRTFSNVDLKCNISKIYSMELLQEDTIQTQNKIQIKKFHCRYCPRRFTEQRDLVRHVSIIHHNDFTNKKENPDGRTVYTEHKNLAQHVSVVVHHDTRPFSCGFCKEAFASKQEMNRHSEKACLTGKYGEFECVICDKKFPSKDLIKNQNSVFHPKEPFSFKKLNPNMKQIGNISINTLLFCPKCDKHFDSRGQFELHNCTASIMNEKAKEKLGKSQNMSQITPENRELNCFICRITFPNKQLLSEHIRKFHQIGIKQIELFSCSKCKKQFYVKRKYQLHVKNCQENIIQSQDKKHSTPKEFQCNHCASWFTYSFNLARHE